MKQLPFFAPFTTGHFKIHGEPISDDAVMVWAYDLRITDPTDPWGGIPALEFDYAPTKRKRERMAWRMRREIIEALSHTETVCTTSETPTPKTQTQP